MIIELGEKLKALRIENHLRQDQVARLVNVEKSSISIQKSMEDLHFCVLKMH